MLRSRRDTRTGRPGPSITFTLGFRVYWCLTPTGKYSGCPHTCDGARTKNLAETIAVLLTDPDSRAMAAHTKAGVGYNIKVAVDAKHKMIVEQTMGDQTTTRFTCSGQMQPADDAAATLLISSYGNDRLGTRGCRLREFCRPYPSM